MDNNFNSFDSFNEDNFDPNGFDPNGFDNASGKKAPLRQTTFNIRIQNATANTMGVELFNWLASYTRIYNPTYSGMTGIYPFTAADVTAANLNNLVYFDRSGNLIVQDNAGAKVTISVTTANLTYLQLFNASGIANWKLNKVRLTTTTDAQFSNEIALIRTTVGGAKSSNSLSPAQFKSPTQFQNKIVDIPLRGPINAECGITLNVNAAEDIQLYCFINEINKPFLNA